MGVTPLVYCQFILHCRCYCNFVNVLHVWDLYMIFVLVLKPKGIKGVRIKHCWILVVKAPFLVDSDAVWVHKALSSQESVIGSCQFVLKPVSRFIWHVFFHIFPMCDYYQLWSFTFNVVLDSSIRHCKQSVWLPQRLCWLLLNSDLDGSHYNVDDASHRAAWHRDAAEHQHDGSLWRPEGKNNHRHCYWLMYCLHWYDHVGLHSSLSWLLVICAVFVFIFLCYNSC